MSGINVTQAWPAFRRFMSSAIRPQRWTFSKTSLPCTNRDAVIAHTDRATRAFANGTTNPNGSDGIPDGFPNPSRIYKSMELIVSKRFRSSNSMAAMCCRSSMATTRAHSAATMGKSIPTSARCSTSPTLTADSPARTSPAFWVPIARISSSCSVITCGTGSTWARVGSHFGYSDHGVAGSPRVSERGRSSGLPKCERCRAAVDHHYRDLIQLPRRPTRSLRPHPLDLPFQSARRLHH